MAYYIYTGMESVGQLGAHAALCDVYVYVLYIHCYAILHTYRSACRAV